MKIVGLGRLLCVLMVLATGAALAQPSLTIPVTLKNGCVIDMPFGETTKSITLSRQEFSPLSCPPNGRHTGFVAVGVGWAVAAPGRDEQSFIGVRIGHVRDGRFEGVRMSQNQGGTLFFLWTDSVTGGGQLRRFVRTDSGYSAASVKAALAEGLANSVSSDKAGNQSHLETMLTYWHDNPAAEMQRFTSDPHTREFMNPKWVGLAGSASQQASQRSGDDPKARGRSARVR